MEKTEAEKHELPKESRPISLARWHLLVTFGHYTTGCAEWVRGRLAQCMPISVIGWVAESSGTHHTPLKCLFSFLFLCVSIPIQAIVLQVERCAFRALITFFSGSPNASDYYLPSMTREADLAAFTRCSPAYY